MAKATAHPDTDPDLLIALIRARPRMTLAQLAKLERIEPLIGKIRVGDLRCQPAQREPGARRLREAALAQGQDFDRLVLQAVREGGGPVGAIFVRERVGGPRWKLQKSFRRLVDNGTLRRIGSTSATRYAVVGD